jgi:hypothetical protein
MQRKVLTPIHHLLKYLAPVLMVGSSLAPVVADVRAHESRGGPRPVLVAQTAKVMRYGPYATIRRANDDPVCERTNQ